MRRSFFACVPIVKATMFFYWCVGGFSLNVFGGLFQESIEIADLQVAWRECDASRKIGEWESVATSEGGPNDPSTSPLVHFKSNGSQFVIVERFADGSRKVTGLNPDYRFTLGAAPNGPFRIQQMYSTDEVCSLRQTLPDALDLWETNLKSCGRHGGLTFNFVTSWPEFVRTRGFRILSCNRTTRDGTPMIEIAFECIPGIETNNSISVFRDGRALFFDKDKYYLPVEASYNVFLSHGSESEYYSEEVSIEYTFDFPPIPQLSEAITRRTVGSTKIERRTNSTTASLGQPFKDEEFRLTAFGIPEPKGLELPSRGWPWWVKLPLAGIVAVGIAALLKRSINKGKK